MEWFLILFNYCFCFHYMELGCNGQMNINKWLQVKEHKNETSVTPFGKNCRIWNFIGIADPFHLHDEHKKFGIHYSHSSAFELGMDLQSNMFLEFKIFIFSDLNDNWVILDFFVFLSITGVGYINWPSLRKKNKWKVISKRNWSLGQKI